MHLSGRRRRAPAPGDNSYLRSNPLASRRAFCLRRNREAHNLGWDHDRIAVVYDWDSLGARSEPAIAGVAAAVFASSRDGPVAANLAQSERVAQSRPHRPSPTCTVRSRCKLNSYLGLMLADSTYSVPLMVLLLRAFLESVPYELIVSARVDGCSELRVLWSVIVPVSVPGIVTASILEPGATSSSA